VYDAHAGDRYYASWSYASCFETVVSRRGASIVWNRLRHGRVPNTHAVAFRSLTAMSSNLMRVLRTVRSLATLRSVCVACVCVCVCVCVCARSFVRVIRVWHL
jgi:hypothetical protein